MEKKESNKLIAEFMGIENHTEYYIGQLKENTVHYSPSNVGFNSSQTQKAECERWLNRQLEKFPNGSIAIGGYEVLKNEVYPFYHLSWDALMPVVEKIYTLVDYRLSVPYNSLSRMYIHNTIELVYLTVVKFIEYYNSKSL